MYTLRKADFSATGSDDDILALGKALVTPWHDTCRGNRCLLAWPKLHVPQRTRINYGDGSATRLQGLSISLSSNYHSILITNTSEVFVIVSLTLFLPICLEQFARDNGFLLPDRTEPCSALKVTTTAESRCVVKVGGVWIDSASFRYCLSINLEKRSVVDEKVVYMCIRSQLHSKL